jgi:hypothetical protein
VFQAEQKDVDMTDASPPKAESSEAVEGGRTMALGAMRRVFKSRQKARSSRSLLVGNREGKYEADLGSESEDDESSHMGPVTQSTSTHYTLNMPPVQVQSDTPHMLLGWGSLPSCVNVALTAIAQLSSILLQFEPDPAFSVSCLAIYPHGAT